MPGKAAAPEFQQFQYALARHIRDPKANPRPAGVPARRMRVYNELLYNNIEGFLLACFPVLRKLLGKRKWAELVRDFFATHRCHTPFFRQIPDEFIRYLQAERGQRDGDPAFLLELAHYEWIELVLSVSNKEPSHAVDPAGDLLLARPMLNPVAALLEYRYPVHRIGPRFKPATPPPQPTYLLVFRDAEYATQFIELNPVTARLVRLLEPGKYTGTQALKIVARELKHADPNAVIKGGIDILRALHAQGAVLGTKVP